MKGYRQLTLLYGLLLMVVAIPVAIYLVEQNADSRNMAANKRGCVEQCPGRDGVLRNCTPPEADGSSEDSVCNVANRVQMCGGKCYVCPSPNGKWKVDDALKCAGTTVVPSIPAGQVGVLNYQISFGGVNPNNAQCTIDWPLKFIILGDGETKVYQNVIPKNKFVLNNKMVFIGSLKLTGFTRLNNLAVFIRGPKHLQVKYGKNNQTGSYNQAGGEIMVTESEVLSPLYDFSGYPLMPGDVVGTYSEQQDDMINGVDFSYIKFMIFFILLIIKKRSINQPQNKNTTNNSVFTNPIKILILP